MGNVNLFWLLGIALLLVGAIALVALKPKNYAIVTSDQGPARSFDLRVTVVAVDLSFGQMVVLFAKAAIAIIPAVAILAIIPALIWLLAFGADFNIWGRLN